MATANAAKRPAYLPAISSGLGTEVQTSYDQINPNFESVEANEDQYEAIVARQESRNFLALNQELNALQNLAASRSKLIESLVDYGMAVIELEKAKGTLPEYDNVIVADPE